jgi:tRNA (mo5U34)-methyltransferase
MDNLIKNLAEPDLKHCSKELEGLIKKKKQLLLRDYGIEKELKQIFDILPDPVPSFIDTDADHITIGRPSDIKGPEKKRLLSILKKMDPWRKGPYEIFGINIDTEWVSYLKWNRIKNIIAPLTDRKVLDIGSSSGYYMFRMLGQNPMMVLGIEPYMRFYYQYRILQTFIKAQNLFCIPAGIEEMPPFRDYFDTVFCMGIMYHRKSPLDMLANICAYMKKGGELILETLVIRGEDNLCLFPDGRYSKMKNVFFIPTVNCLSSFLRRSGFENIRCADVSVTTRQEQRKTEWINTESLEDFLDPMDPFKTVEGYPAPIRAILIANKRV